MPPTLPDSIVRDASPVPLDDPGWWLVLGDVHLPYHDRQTIELAVKEAKKNKVAGVLLNGDILDSHELSRFDKSPEEPRYKDEIQIGRQFLSYLRYHLACRFVWKDGNHEERLAAYLMQRAPALFGFEEIGIPNLMQFHKHAVEYITDKRIAMLGKLPALHGHEYRPNIQTPVNPARGLFLRTKSNAICNHFHQTSEHHEPTIESKPKGCWSIGCACGLSPLYMPLNKWNLGFGMVKVGPSGDFEVRNLRVIDGRVV